MSKIQLVCIGKTKNSLWEPAVREYTKRISRFCTLEILEIKENILPDHPSLKIIENALNKEGIEIEEKKTKESVGIVLDSQGKPLNSMEFSALLQQHLYIEGHSITFIIGSSYGLSPAIKEKYRSISFSKLTFPHQLCRILLLEQLFRGFKILAEETYHK
ncbi:MAG: 23S rRNA (pseudouridine(1915)-N(3))-methyltransferase RlmH [Caldisericia bacterium]|nr:23S rRNA (pseudouridine(1915)-N(3))-methyltransferase RlmH [Caldisericia bacterium]MDD4613881.1 23S rRNA (pseudouridine(1915)-N(3))-methyltransferase RlmH [Caldisericia bacterium]